MLFDEEYLPGFNDFQEMLINPNFLFMLSPQELFDYNVSKMLEQLKNLKGFDKIINNNTFLNIKMYTNYVKHPENKKILGYVLGYINSILRSKLTLDKSIERTFELAKTIPIIIGEIQQYEILRYIRYWEFTLNI